MKQAHERSPLSDDGFLLVEASHMSSCAAPAGSPCRTGLEFLHRRAAGSHDPSGVVFAVLAALSGKEREYIRDRTLEGQHPSPATVMRILSEHDEKTAAAAAVS